MQPSRMFVLAAACVLVSQQAAVGGETLDRLGRLWGFGWSDGYHACGVDSFQFGENLPPRSNLAADRPWQSHSIADRPSPRSGDCDLWETADAGDWLPMAPPAPRPAFPPVEPLPPPSAEEAEPLRNPEAQSRPASPIGYSSSRFPRKLAQ